MTQIKPEGGPTFCKGVKSSKIDFVAITNTAFEHTTSVVLEQESGSDHKYVQTKLKYASQTSQNREYTGTKWILDTNKIKKTCNLINNLDLDNANTQEDVNKILDNIEATLERTLKKKKINTIHKKNNWWTMEIQEIRKKVNTLRRKTQQLRKKHEYELAELHQVMYLSKKVKLKQEIIKEKKNAGRSYARKLTETYGGDHTRLS